MTYVKVNVHETKSDRKSDAQWMKDHAKVSAAAVKVHADAHAQYAASAH